MNENDEFEIDFELDNTDLNLDKKIISNPIQKNNKKENKDDLCNLESGIFSEDDPFKDVGNIIEDLSSKKNKNICQDDIFGEFNDNNLGIDNIQNKKSYNLENLINKENPSKINNNNSEKQNSSKIILDKQIGLFEKTNQDSNDRINCVDEFGFEIDTKNNLNNSKFQGNSTDRDKINFGSVEFNKNKSKNYNEQKKIDTSINLSSITASRENLCLEQLMIKNLDNLVIKKYLKLNTYSKEYPVVNIKSGEELNKKFKIKNPENKLKNMILVPEDKNYIIPRK